MKKQNLLAALLLIASMPLGSFWYAAWTDNVLPIEELSDVNQCGNLSKVYLNQDNDADGKSDYYLYLNSNFILNGSANTYTAGQILREANGVQYTKVKYYAPLPNMLYKMDSANQPALLDEYTFRRASRVFPYNTPLRGIATTPNKVVFEQPSDDNASNNTVSFIYDYRYKYAVGFDGTSSSAYRYNQVPSMNYMLNTGLTYITLLPWSAGNRKRLWSAETSTSSCKNYEIHRCGNGVIDTPDNGYVSLFTGETCDDGPLNGTAGHCPLGCWGAATQERCGDEVLQPAGTFYNGDPNTVSFEECDDGDLTGDTNGIINGDDPALNFCSSICLPTFTEAFVEVFINP